MPVVDLSVPRSVHLVGVGGAGISAIGIILATMGHRVSGADVTETPNWPALTAAGVNAEVVGPDEIFAAANRHGAEIVAHSSAFVPSPADLADAEASGRTLTSRAGILAAICVARPSVAVSGTHGKTSTTALLATLLEGVGADPSYLVGAVPVGLGRAARWGGAGGAFIVEADESDGSFLALGAATAVVTNVDEDHLDYWGSIEAIEAAFDRFLAAADTRIVCIDDARTDPVRADERAVRLASAHGAVTVGEADGAHYRIHDVDVRQLTTTFGLAVDGTELGPVAIATPGRHHARNAAVALATAAELGVDPRRGAAALGAFAGVSRRFEVIGEAAGVTVVDDYAHNPGKVRALLGSAQEAGWRRVVVVFQPHRYTRTRDQGSDFGAALALADVVAVTEVYAAGEMPLAGVSGRTLLDAVLDRRPWAPVAWVPTLDDATAWATGTLRPGDLCLTVGAGDVAGLGPRLVAALDPVVTPGAPTR
ncbi:UDP-N-acetylmuramate--L-alanine ligase [soil metagenome]